MTEQNNEDILHFVNYFRNKAAELELQNIDLQLQVQKLSDEVKALQSAQPTDDESTD